MVTSFEHLPERKRCKSQHNIPVLNTHQSMLKIRQTLASPELRRFGRWITVISDTTNKGFTPFTVWHNIAKTQ